MVEAGGIEPLAYYLLWLTGLYLRAIDISIALKFGCF